MKIVANSQIPISTFTIRVVIAQPSAFGGSTVRAGPAISHLNPVAKSSAASLGYGPPPGATFAALPGEFDSI